jgi:transposase
MIDATIVRAHQHAAGARGGQALQSLGRSCGGFSSKIHAKVDALGMPLQFVLTAGEAHEIKSAEALLANDKSDYLLADRGYDCNELRNTLVARGTQPVIPGKRDRLQAIEYDTHIYKERNCIERFFNRIKHFRRISTRYDKTAIMFMGALIIAAIFIWLKL